METIKRTDVHKLLKLARACYVAETRSGAMVTNTYAAWIPGKATRDEFSHYNLTAEPGQYVANGKLERQECENVPNLDQIVGKAESENVPATFAEFWDRRLRVEAPDGTAHALIVADAPDPDPVFVASRYVELVESEHSPAEWRASESGKPVTAHDADGRIVALVMPVRIR